MDRSSLRVHQYSPEDRGRCLRIFDGNIPESFTGPERSAFESFLDALPGPYLLLETDPGDLVACGGYAIVPGAASADLCWGMVARDQQGKGVGRLLAQVRIQRIREEPGIVQVAMNTSQHTRGFYEKLGFVTERVVLNGIAPGLDRCDMRLLLY